MSQSSIYKEHDRASAPGDHQKLHFEANQAKKIALMPRGELNTLLEMS